MDSLIYDLQYFENGAERVCGVDEAGRGPLAGPVFTAAVVFEKGVIIEGINDSKKLSEKKRDQLFDIIKSEALCYCIACATEAEIDSQNILQATLLSMRRSVSGLLEEPDIVLVDGNADPKLTYKTELVVKGDAKSQAIAAASILAKVARDRHMKDLDKKYPEYGFAQHKGYPTKAHYEAIEKHGITPAHRHTFLKKLNKKSKDKTDDL